MDKILSNLTSPAWWIGVVLVGTLVSLIAAYLKPVIDKVLSRLSTYWKERVEQKNKKREEEIMFLRDNPEQRIATHFQEMSCRIRATQYFILSVMVLVFSFTAFEGNEESVVRIIVNAAFLIIMIMGLREHYGAMKLNSKLSDSLHGYSRSSNNAN